MLLYLYIIIIISIHIILHTHISYIINDEEKSLLQYYLILQKLFNSSVNIIRSENSFYVKVACERSQLCNIYNTSTIIKGDIDKRY